jgi:S1-C subfamily serine protease
MKDKFLKIHDHNDLSSFFDLTYTELSKTIYQIGDRYKYMEFSIPKKNGGTRLIRSPRRKLKIIQKRLSDTLYEIYPTRAPVHGFVKDKSTVDGATKHLDKTYIFNIDLKDFFNSIHFGRVRNLFCSSPFFFSYSVSTVLAQICCYKNCLPQGAPTSPIISNMISLKLDLQLQYLAKNTNSTYTRYADDITFSFTCRSTNRIPEEIVIIRNGVAGPGHALTQIINNNGFEINYNKVRFSGKSQRMEVTGITVNNFTNVPRSYVRNINSILYAWEKHGYAAAEKEHIEKYDTKTRASSSPKSLKFVVRGKLSYMRSVRGWRDRIFNKLAAKFNALVEEDLQFSLFFEKSPEHNAVDSLWIIESCYDDDSGDVITAQGTGFFLKNYGLVTCAHVVSEKKKLFNEIEAYQCTDTSKKYRLRVIYLDDHRDIAICKLAVKEIVNIPKACIDIHDGDVVIGAKVKLLGFPGFAPGSNHYVADASVASTYTQNKVNKFEIDTQIRQGISGGPIINESGHLMGIALEGATRESGKNAVIVYKELKYVISDNYKL